MLQMYESEDNRGIQEEELAAILGIMLGVKEVKLCGKFLELGRVTYGKSECARGPKGKLNICCVCATLIS